MLCKGLFFAGWQEGLPGFFSAIDEKFFDKGGGEE